MGALEPAVIITLDGEENLRFLTYISTISFYLNIKYRTINQGGFMQQATIRVMFDEAYTKLFPTYKSLRQLQANELFAKLEMIKQQLLHCDLEPKSPQELANFINVTTNVIEKLVALINTSDISKMLHLQNLKYNLASEVTKVRFAYLALHLESANYLDRDGSLHLADNFDGKIVHKTAVEERVHTKKESKTYPHFDYGNLQGSITITPAENTDEEEKHEHVKREL